jgi:hypothetical protein
LTFRRNVIGSTEGRELPGASFPRGAVAPQPTFVPVDAVCTPV